MGALGEVGAGREEEGTDPRMRTWRGLGSVSHPTTTQRPPPSSTATQPRWQPYLRCRNHTHLLNRLPITTVSHFSLLLHPSLFLLSLSLHLSSSNFQHKMSVVTKVVARQVGLLSLSPPPSSPSLRHSSIRRPAFESPPPRSHVSRCAAADHTHRSLTLVMSIHSNATHRPSRTRRSAERGAGLPVDRDLPKGPHADISLPCSALPCLSSRALSLFPVIVRYTQPYRPG